MGGRAWEEGDGGRQWGEVRVEGGTRRKREGKKQNNMKTKRERGRKGREYHHFGG